MDLTLAPLSSIITFSDLSIWRIGEGMGPDASMRLYLITHVSLETMAPTSALPIGATRVVSEMQPLRIDPALPGSGLYNAVLAIIAPPNPDESERYDEEVLDLNVTGYIVVSVSPVFASWLYANPKPT